MTRCWLVKSNLKIFEFFHQLQISPLKFEKPRIVFSFYGIDAVSDLIDFALQQTGQDSKILNRLRKTVNSFGVLNPHFHPLC